jgi:DNA repair photolyase
VTRPALQVEEVSVGNVLTRAGGYLLPVASHSLQPYRGCSFGRALCGVGCYVRANPWVTRGREWGSFLEVRTDAAESYARHVTRERRWARRDGGAFRVFMSSSTDPFVPQERRYRVTRRVLEAMREEPPDTLILQTHTHLVLDELPRLVALAAVGDVRVHVSIESDRDRLPGLPPPASSVARRLEACAALKAAGVPVVVTAAPLLPVEDPDGFFARIAEVSDAVVLDHFVGGDGTADGRRTRATALPAAMAALDPESVEPAYLERMVTAAARHLPGRVGVGAPGFAGVYDRG